MEGDPVDACDKALLASLPSIHQIQIPLDPPAGKGLEKGGGQRGQGGFGAEGFWAQVP